MYKAVAAYLVAIISVNTNLAYAQQFGRTADRKNFTSSKQVADKPSVKWKFKTNGKVFASPILVNNLVLTGSCDSTLYALDKKSGSLAWKFRAGGEIRSSVASSGNKLFFISTDGIFYALDAGTGKQVWTFQTAGEQFYDTWDYYQSSPAVSNGAVYFGCGDGYIYALDEQTGKMLWKFKTGGIVHASPAVADNAVLAGSFDGFFYCINTDGSLRWKFNTIGEHYFPKGEVQFNATVADSTVFFSARDYNIYALKIKDGGGHWVYHQPGSWPSVPSLAGERLVVTMSDAHNVAVLGKTYGEKLYEPFVPLNVFSSAAINNNAAYFGCMDGKLYKLDILTGKVSVVFQTTLSRKNHAAFFDASQKLRDDLLAKHRDDINALYDAFLTMGSILSTVWIDNGVLYFGSADNCIYAIE